MSVLVLWNLFCGWACWNLQCQQYVHHWESLRLQVEEWKLGLWGSDGPCYLPDLALKPRNLQTVSERLLRLPCSFMYRNLLCNLIVADEPPAEEHQQHFLLSPKAGADLLIGSQSWCWGGIQPRTLDTSSAAAPGHATGVKGHVAFQFI